MFGSMRQRGHFFTMTKLVKLQKQLWTEQRTWGYREFFGRCRMDLRVRRQGFWNQWQLKLRESSAHLVGLIMRRAVCDASVAL